MESDTIDNILNDANDIALSWYSILSGKPLPTGPPPIQPQPIVGVYQTPATVYSPGTVSIGVSSQPWVIAGIAVIVIAVVFLSQK